MKFHPILPSNTRIWILEPSDISEAKSEAQGLAESLYEEQF